MLHEYDKNLKMVPEWLITVLEERNASFAQI